MRCFIHGLTRDRRGVSAVEFALIAPAVLTLIIGAMNLGIYFWSKNALDHAIDETARYATIYPTPDTAALRTRFDDSLTRSFPTGTLSFTSTAGTTSGVNYLDLQATTSIKVDLALKTFGNIPIVSTRRVFLPK